jgi:hypothetical protein
MQTEQKALAEAVEYLREGDLDSAHKIAQSREGEPLADTVHAIIHRREGDYSNSLYWWHRVGVNAPTELASLYGSDPAAFVRRCQMASPGSAEAKECHDLQERELDVLATLCEASAHA